MARSVTAQRSVTPLTLRPPQRARRIIPERKTMMLWVTVFAVMIGIVLSVAVAALMLQPKQADWR